VRDKELQQKIQQLELSCQKLEQPTQLEQLVEEIIFWICVLVITFWILSKLIFGWIIFEIMR